MVIPAGETFLLEWVIHGSSYGKPYVTALQALKDIDFSLLSKEKLNEENSRKRKLEFVLWLLEEGYVTNATRYKVFVRTHDNGFGFQIFERG